MQSPGKSDTRNHIFSNPQLIQSDHPFSTKLARILLILNGIIWSILGGISLLMAWTAPADNEHMGWMIALFMFINAALFLTSGLGLGRQPKRFFILAILLVCANIILTVTDEVGLFEWLTLGIDLVLFLLLIINRSRYFANTFSL